MSKCKWLYSSIVLITIAVIFFFSHQPGAISKVLSDTIGATIADAQIDNTTKDTVYMLLGVDIRKLAHIFLYFILGVFTSLMFKAWLKNKKIYASVICSILFCFIAAAFDEWHQSFVPGRTGAFTDILIDAIGFTISIAMFYLFMYIRKK